MSEDAARRYYLGLRGAWAGPFALTITDRAALRASVTRAGRAQVTSMAWLTRLLGPTQMATTLGDDAASKVDGFVHTTRVRKAGVTLYTTEERIQIGADGSSLRMDGTTRAIGGAAESYEAIGSVDATATRARYEIPWLGVTLIQETEIVPEGLWLRQRTAWMRGEVLLRRAPG